ncbi:MAG: SCP2 sterol-binding domain-containing protein, partial [Anaerolineales bacterium]
RANPVRVFYGNSTLRPDFDVQMHADAFHLILLGELSLGKALGDGKLKVKGPVYKSFALADIFHRGQAVYPTILDQFGV